MGDCYVSSVFVVNVRGADEVYQLSVTSNLHLSIKLDNMIAIVERFALSIEFHIKWKLRTTLYFMVVGTNVTLISSDNDYTIVLNCAILVQFEVGCLKVL